MSMLKLMGFKCEDNHNPQVGRQYIRDFFEPLSRVKGAPGDEGCSSDEDIGPRVACDESNAPENPATRIVMTLQEMIHKAADSPRSEAFVWA